jgi:hypothetical protein
MKGKTEDSVHQYGEERIRRRTPSIRKERFIVKEELDELGGKAGERERVPKSGWFDDVDLWIES